jgi:LuxR family transcriptional regulator, maltose regulon positive regulatory protein
VLGPTAGSTPPPPGPTGGADAPRADDGPAADLPILRQRLVPRTSLLERLVASPERVVSIVAPPGYGKTTLLSQLAERVGPRLAWVSCERADNDPVVLWSHVLAALDRFAPVAADGAAVLAGAGGGVEAVPKLMSVIDRLAAPVTIVLDHLDAIDSPQCALSIAELAHRVPDGWRLALASRDATAVPLTKLRMERRLLEVGVDQLAMTDEEAAVLLREAGADVSVAEAAELVTRTEGWPAGLYLAALAIRSGAPVSGFGFTGDDRLVDDYIRSELLARLTTSQLGFLIETSILERLTGPLCDAVLAGRGSGRGLEELARRNLLVVPLDRRGEWYRYHHLLRELLQAELRRGDPDRAGELHSRAADWYEANDMAEAAIEHVAAAGDTERLARLVLELMQPVWASGRVDTVRGWMELLDKRPVTDCHAAIAAHGALTFALLGHAREAERWVAVAESLPAIGVLPDGSTVGGTLAYLRAIIGRDGPAAMRTDATLALETLSPASPYRATMLHTQAISYVLEGDLTRAGRLFTHAGDVAEAFGATPLFAMVLAEQALICAELDQDLRAEALLARAVEIVDSQQLDAYWTSALVFAADAHCAARRGDLGTARRLVQRAARLRPLLTYVLPVGSVQVSVELVRTYLALGDTAGATAVLEEAEGIIDRRPDLGTLGTSVHHLRQQVDQIAGARAAGASSLTVAELRLVPLLPTHLSLPQIADRLYVSPHTVKAQVKSVYRKLGVSSRAEAVEAMTDLGVSA